MKRYKKDLKQLNCFKIKLENTRNKFSLNIENCCSCQNNKLKKTLMPDTKLHHHIHTCYSGTKLSRSNSENYSKTMFKNPQMFVDSNNKTRTLENSLSSNNQFLKNNLYKGEEPYKKHSDTLELNKSVLSTPKTNKKECLTSRYDFQRKLSPLFSREESSSRYQNTKLPDFRRSIDRIYSMENTSTSTSIDSKFKRPMSKIPTEKRFLLFKSNNTQNILKEPVNAQRKTMPKLEKSPTYNDSDSYLDSIRNLSSSELNTYIEKLINQFRIKTKINTTFRTDPEKLNKAFANNKEKKEKDSKQEASQQEKTSSNVNNNYRDDLFVVSEMSIKNSNASEDTYIKKILNEEEEEGDEEESISVEELNLEDESEESNGLINYTHSYELEDLSSQNTSFNQESSSSIKK